MRKIAIALIAFTMIIAGCGGGGCDAGKPTFASQKWDCPEQADPPASAASR